MLREAAYLGLPAYSIFRSEIGQVDQYLESIGRLAIVDSPASFDRIAIERRRLEPLMTPGDGVGELVARMERVVTAQKAPRQSGPTRMADGEAPPRHATND